MEFYGGNEARSLAFRAVPETCPVVQEALRKARMEILEYLGLKECTRIEMILDEAFDTITRRATIPLRRALIDAEQKSLP